MPSELEKIFISILEEHQNMMEYVHDQEVLDKKFLALVEEMYGGNKLIYNEATNQVPVTPNKQAAKQVQQPQDKPVEEKPAENTEPKPEEPQKEEKEKIENINDAKFKDEFAQIIKVPEISKTVQNIIKNHDFDTIISDHMKERGIGGMDDKMSGEMSEKIATAKAYVINSMMVYTTFMILAAAGAQLTVDKNKQPETAVPPKEEVKLATPAAEELLRILKQEMNVFIETDIFGVPMINEGILSGVFNFLKGHAVAGFMKGKTEFAKISTNAIDLENRIKLHLKNSGGFEQILNEISAAGVGNTDKLEAAIVELANAENSGESLTNALNTASAAVTKKMQATGKDFVKNITKSIFASAIPKRTREKAAEAIKGVKEKAGDLKTLVGSGVKSDTEKSPAKKPEEVKPRVQAL